MFKIMSTWQILHIIKRETTVKKRIAPGSSKTGRTGSLKCTETKTNIIRIKAWTQLQLFNSCKTFLLFD